MTKIDKIIEEEITKIDKIIEEELLRLKKEAQKELLDKIIRNLKAGDYFKERDNILRYLNNIKKELFTDN